MTFVRLKPQHPLASSDSFHHANRDFLQSAELVDSPAARMTLLLRCKVEVVDALQMSWQQDGKKVAL